jgi:hypothetical protein
MKFPFVKGRLATLPLGLEPQRCERCRKILWHAQKTEYRLAQKGPENTGPRPSFMQKMKERTWTISPMFLSSRNDTTLTTELLFYRPNCLFCTSLYLSICCLTQLLAYCLHEAILLGTPPRSPHESNGKEPNISIGRFTSRNCTPCSCYLIHQ